MQKLLALALNKTVFERNYTAISLSILWFKAKNDELISKLCEKPYFLFRVLNQYFYISQ